MRRPRIRVINHFRARDAEEEVAEEGAGSTTLPFEKKQKYDEALTHLKRAVNAIPSSVMTQGQAQAAGRALGLAKQELELAMRLLSGGDQSK